MGIPIYLTLVVGGVFLSLWLIAWREKKQFNILSLGPVYLGIVALYSIFPFAIFQLTGFVLTNSFDNRLLVLKPEESDITNFSLLYLCYIAGFATAYILAKRTPIAFNYFSNIKIDLMPTIVVYLTLTLVVTAIAFLYLPRATDYHDTYAVLDRIPLFFRQIYLQATGTLSVVKLVLLYRLLVIEKNWKLALVFLGFELVMAFNPAGSRRDFFLLLFCFLCLYSFFVVKIKVRTAATLGIAGILAFLLLGTLRSGFINSGATATELLSANSEFTAMFVTAFDVQQKTLSGVAPSIGIWLYLGDFIGLIPQQLLPFEKISPPDWYMHTFYPDAVGQGYGFGVIAESALGFGLPEAAARGLVVGLIFALFQRIFLQNRKNFIVGIFYVWFAGVMYNCFRVTTFFPIHMFVFQFVPAMLMVVGLSHASRMAIRSR